MERGRAVSVCRSFSTGKADVEAPSACPAVTLDRFALEDAAWLEVCAPNGSLAAAQWADYVALHARAARGEYSRVLVIQDMDFAQGVGNSMRMLSNVFRHAMAVRRAVFINVSAPVMMNLAAGATAGRTPNSRMVRIERFNPGAHMTGRDGVDWRFTGPEGDALAARWRAAGMRETRARLPTWRQQGCPIPELIATDWPPVGSVEEAAHSAQSPAWLTLVGFSCYTRVVALVRQTRNDTLARCRLNALMRPRLHLQRHIRAALRTVAQGACAGANASRVARTPSEPRRLV